MKRIYFFLAVLTQLVLLAACSEEELVPNKSGDIDGNEYTPYVIPGRPITISADIEQQGSNTRTALSGLDVVWSEGDAFSLMTKAGETLTEPEWDLEAKVSNKSAGVGINVGSYSKGYVRYKKIQFLDANKNDVTSTVTGTSYYTSNYYKVGVCRSYGGSYIYCYRPAGESVEGDINSSHIPFLQSSSTSPSLPVYVKMKGIEYSTDNSTWTALESSKLGSYGGKNSIEYVWNESTSVQTGSKFSVNIDNADAGKTSASFSGNLKLEDATHYAIYPYSESNTISGDNITFTMPAEQQYVEGSFGNGANPAVGVLEQKENGDYHISFLNVCGVLKLQLKGTQKIASITVKDKAGKALSGTATVACKDVTATSVAAAEVTGSSSVVLNCGTGVQLSSEPTNFYIVVPAGAFSGGFEVEARSTDGLIGTLETSRDNTIKQNTIKAMPAIELEFVEEFNIENTTAAYYVANSTSTFSSSFLSNSTFQSLRSSALTSNPAYRNDQPNVKTITWLSTNEATVTWSENKDYSAPCWSATSTTGSYSFANMVPGKKYYWKVTTGEDLVKSGVFRVTGQLRMIKIDHSWNMRDMGGWTGWNGNMVRYEQIYRGGSIYGQRQDGETYQLPQDEINELHRLGLKAHLDLRALPGYGKWPTGGTNLNSFAKDGSAVTGLEYQMITTDFCLYEPLKYSGVIGDLAFIIAKLKEGKPVYYHCRTGADRTGTVGFTILGLLGCDENSIARDYELTSLGMDEAKTIAYNEYLENGGSFTASYSDRPANSIGYGFFSNIRSLTSSKVTLNSIQDKVYYYLNRYYYDNNVNTGGKVYINKDDLDWFVNYMLGTTGYEGPSWALNYSNNTLETVISTAATKNNSLK